MIKHHPDDNMLTEYSSGSLAWALGISVAAHIQLCPHCRQRVDQLNKLGGTILTNSIAERVEPNTFTNLMDKIRAQPSAPSAEKISAAPTANYVQQQAKTKQQDPMFSHMPKVITKLLPGDGKLKWRRASSTLKTAQLKTGQTQYEVAFQKISSGGKVLEHDHSGLEVTLVLFGSFSDENGIYTKGDFLVRTPGEVHRPTATLNEDCLCLSVCEAPVKITGLWGKVINPFLGFHPA